MMRRQGFTLLELIVVIIIIGILATLGFSQYAKMIEKGRSAESKIILGQVRTAQEAYNLEYVAYATDISLLAVSAPPTSCAQSTHYFSYAVSNTTATATRCTVSGKTPVGPAAYTLTLTYSTAAWGGTAGYY